MASGDDWRLKRERLGLAWQEPDGAGGWRKRKGRCPEGWLDERAANIEAVAAMERHALNCRGEQRARDNAQRKVTVRELANEWLRWLEEVYGAKPSTLSDYRFLLREPAPPQARLRCEPWTDHGCVRRPAAADVTTAEVSRFLRAAGRRGSDSQKRQQASPDPRGDLHLRMPRRTPTRCRQTRGPAQTSGVKIHRPHSTTTRSKRSRRSPALANAANTASATSRRTSTS